jgi:hypothetical protein
LSKPCCVSASPQSMWLFRSFKEQRV